jgi:hypothetical protein
MAKISVLGVDLGKNVCSAVGLDASGAVVMRRRMRRETLIALAEKLPACVVGMEACCCSAGNRFTPRRYRWPRRGFVRSERKRPSCKRGLREGDHEMA